AARALRAHRPPGAHLLRGGGVLPCQAQERRHADGACRARPRDPAGAPAPLPPRLPDARRPALPGSEPRAVAAPAGLDLLVRARSDPRQLRRGARARHERARVAVDLVGPPVERGARADAARRARPDARDRRARRHRHLSFRMPARVRGLGGARQGVRGAGGSGSLPPARRRRRGEARGPEGSRRGRAHPTVAARALAALKARERRLAISGAGDAAPGGAAAGAYRDASARLLPEATAAGIRLAIEVIHPLRQALSFINTLADAREIARAAGRRGGYVLDFFHSGWERRLLETVRADAAARIHAVQLSDVKRVTLRTMDRALLGKGILPLRALVRTLERGGYRGWYEAEIISDDLERMGYERALRQTRAAFARLIG